MCALNMLYRRLYIYYNIYIIVINHMLIIYMRFYVVIVCSFNVGVGRLSYGGSIGKARGPAFMEIDAYWPIGHVEPLLGSI